jgi:hypothetical protein
MPVSVNGGHTVSVDGRMFVDGIAHRRGRQFGRGRLTGDAHRRLRPGADESEQAGQHEEAAACHDEAALSARRQPGWCHD